VRGHTAQLVYSCGVRQWLENALPLGEALLDLGVGRQSTRGTHRESLGGLTLRKTEIGDPVLDHEAR
jgi:hypothetical protein